MKIDIKLIFNGVLLLIVIILTIMIVTQRSKVIQGNNFIDELERKNEALRVQIDKLKQNFIDIGIADSIETRSIDSLIAISTRKVGDLRGEAKTYRDALEEMKTREWKRLTEPQKTRQIEEALNYLKKNEENN